VLVATEVPQLALNQVRGLDGARMTMLHTSLQMSMKQNNCVIIGIIITLYLMLGCRLQRRCIINPYHNSSTSALLFVMQYTGHQCYADHQKYRSFRIICPFLFSFFQIVETLVNALRNNSDQVLLTPTGILQVYDHPP
jgi:hypothetical protein